MTLIGSQRHRKKSIVRIPFSAPTRSNAASQLKAPVSRQTDRDC